MNDDTARSPERAEEVLAATPWFESASGYVEFVKFQGEIETLARYVELLAESLWRTLDQQRASFSQRQFLEEAPSGWEGEAELVLTSLAQRPQARELVLGLATSPGGDRLTMSTPAARRT